MLATLVLSFGWASQRRLSRRSWWVIEPAKADFIQAK